MNQACSTGSPDASHCFISSCCVRRNVEGRLLPCVLTSTFPVFVIDKYVTTSVSVVVC